MSARSFHSPKDYLDLANSPEVTPDELRSLAGSPYVFVVQAVARNAATPADVLPGLMPTRVDDQKGQLMLELLARNPVSPEGVLRQVAQLVPQTLRENHSRFGFEAGMALFERPDTPDNVLIDLLRDPEVTREFRRVAARRTVHAAVLDELARDRSERVRRTAQKRLAELR